jgi:hypothetical protein
MQAIIRADTANSKRPMAGLYIHVDWKMPYDAKLLSAKAQLTASDHR